MKHLTFLLIAFSIFSIGCDDDAENELLIYDQEDVRIFLEAVNDARCPIDVDCIWEGNAEVSFIMIANGQAENFVLNTYDQYITQLSVLGNLVSLISVSPYPDINIEIVPELEDYEIILSVE